MKTNLILFFLLLSVAATAQTPRQFRSARAANVNVELAGNAGILSLNYDQRFSKGTSGLGARIGVGVTGGGSSHIGFPQFILTVPVGLNYLVGAGPHQLEAGAGVTFIGETFTPVGKYGGATKFFVPSIGYRYQPLNKAPVFRAFFSPFIGRDGGPFGGISIGARL